MTPRDKSAGGGLIIQEHKVAIIEYIPYLRRYAFSLIGNQKLADQLVHNSIKCALDLIRLIPAGAHVKVWLFTIFHNLHNEIINDDKEFSHATDQANDDQDIGEQETLAITSNDPELLKALNGLPLQQKQVFLLVVLEAMAYEDVCKILNIPLGSLLSHLHSARRTISVHLFSKAETVALGCA